jgi:hypothetical protein
MPTNKDFKPASPYTAARAHLVARQPVTKKQQARTPDYAKLAGFMSDAALKAKTGCTWARWVKALDCRTRGRRRR